MKIVIAALLAISLAAACAQPRQTAIQSLETEVMAVHDSVMPRMSDLLRLKRRVSAVSDSTADAARKEQALAISTKLTRADRAMMDWMHQYNADTLKKLDQPAALRYLTAEKTKIEQVREAMLSSIAEAEQFLRTP